MDDISFRLPKEDTVLLADIEAKDAHLWWRDSTKEIYVCQFQSSIDRSILRHSSYLSDSGASYMQWAKELTDEQRVQWMMEMVIEFLAKGYSAHDVIGQFLKVRQFAELGGKSYMMCRTFFKRLDGAEYEDPAAFAEKYLP
jgi:hypothetical protein